MAEVKWADIEAANKATTTVDIRGKKYVTVAQRVKAFRMVYPCGTIASEMLSNDNGVCVFRAQVFDGQTLLGIGHAQEKETASQINRTSMVENAETSAIGRALGMAGFGVDAEIASAEEMVKAFNAQQSEQSQTQTAPKTQAPAPQAKSMEPKATPQQIEYLAERYTGANRAKLLAANGITLLEELPRTKANELIAKLTEKDRKAAEAQAAATSQAKSVEFAGGKLAGGSEGNSTPPPPDDEDLPFDLTDGGAR